MTERVTLNAAVALTLSVLVSSLSCVTRARTAEPGEALGSVQGPTSARPLPGAEGKRLPVLPGVCLAVEALAGNPHVALGVPLDADPSDDCLLDERAYVESYDRALRVPRWVSWRLSAADLGHVRRHDSFRPDPALGAEGGALVSDYLHSGFDRGHLCPSADRTRDLAENRATFLLTNVLPQFHQLNAGPWEKLEARCRARVRDAQIELYIVAGGVFDPSPPMIGRGVAVPKANYKIVLELRRGQRPEEVGRDTPVTAVLMPNVPELRSSEWTSFRTSVDEIERSTGYDFLSNLNEEVSSELEATWSGGLPHPRSDLVEPHDGMRERRGTARKPQSASCASR